MTELEKMQRAQMYLKKLADGIDPLTNKELPEDTALNQVRLSRCFYYAADILDQVIRNGGEIGVKRKPKKLDFYITPEELEAVPISREPVMITWFCKTINQTVDQEDRKNLSYRLLTDWLVEQGILRVEEIRGKARKRVTEKAWDIGIVEELRQGQAPGTEYYAILYEASAQRYLLDHLPEILTGQKDLDEE